MLRGGAALAAGDLSHGLRTFDRCVRACVQSGHECMQGAMKFRVERLKETPFIRIYSTFVYIRMIRERVID